MQQGGSVNSNDRFFFPQGIVYMPFEGDVVVVSITTANWIVLKSEFQQTLLHCLVDGASVGEVYSLVKSEDHFEEFRQLLAAITARDFARIDHEPVIELLEGYKMLNCYLTNACNLRCEHCFMQSGVKLKEELSPAEWIRVLTEFHNAGGESVTFSGGEPLMNKAFPEIVKYANEIGLNVTVLSNGILWSQDMIEKLSPYITEIQISIDGVDEESNSIVRGKGHFDKVTDTVVAFANKGVRTSVATTFTLRNLHDNTGERYKQMVEDIKSRSVNPVFFKLSKKVLQGRNTHYSEEENRLFYNQIMEIEKCVDENAQFNNFMEGHTPNLLARNCGFGGISIGADGEVYFCNRISEVESYGNVKGKPLDAFMKLGHDLHLATSVDNLSPCKDCPLRYICSGGCRIDECNFEGKLEAFEGDLIQVKCTEKYKERLLRKMVESYNFYYSF